MKITDLEWKPLIKAKGYDQTYDGFEAQIGQHTIYHSLCRKEILYR